jgi:predicted dehydrogenase
MKPTTRRALLHSASIVPFAAVRGSAANSAVSVGLIGCGTRGTFLGQVLTEHTQARLAGICDLYPERMERARDRIGRSNVTLFRDMDQLLASPVDAVLIATPVFLHPQHFAAAMQARKHIYLEKPAAPDVEGSRKIENAAAGVKDRDLTFGFQRRYGAVYQKAYEFFAAGKIGKIRMASARFIKASERIELTPVPVPKTFDERVKGWGFWRELSGDLIVENNCHLIDVLNWFMGGRPESATGEGGRVLIRAGDNRDHGNIVFQYPGGVQATLCGMTLAPSFHRDVREEFYGAAGVLETSENGWRHKLAQGDFTSERSPRNISYDSVAAFVARVGSGKYENTIARGVESTLTSILGRLAMDLHRPVNWSEMIAMNGWAR